MRYFPGFPSFSIEPVFDPSLFVEFRKKLGADQINSINEKIISLKTHLESPKKESKPTGSKDSLLNDNDHLRGRDIYDATDCPQDIAYPTDLQPQNGGDAKGYYLAEYFYEQENYT